MNNYVCKIANEEDIKIKWDYEIEISNDKSNLAILKEENIDRLKRGLIIQYYGILDERIICEATAMLSPEVVQNSDDLVGDGVCYLSAFKTNKEFQGRGYFSKLFKFMINDLKSKGYRKVTLGVEPKELKNKEIYFHYGFNEHIKNDIESYSDGTEIEVEYYGKNLK